MTQLYSLPPVWILLHGPAPTHTFCLLPVLTEAPSRGCQATEGPMTFSLNALVYRKLGLDGEPYFPQRVHTK